MIKIIKVLGVLIVIVIVVVALLLLPHHLQIREVTPELPSKEDLVSLIGHQDGPVQLRYIKTSTQELAQGVLAHSTFVVEWQGGKTLLIDLGMDETVAVEFGELFEKVAGASPAVSFGTIPKLMGDSLKSVKGVAFTHLHQDHVQGIQAICESGATGIVALHTSDQFNKHNLHTVDQSNMLKNSACVEQVELTDDSNSSELFPGIGIIPLGGHTPGSTLFAIPINNTLWILSGDITNTKSDLIENRGKGLIYSYLAVPEFESRLEMLRLWLRDLDSEANINVVVSHDTNALLESGMQEWSESLSSLKSIIELIRSKLNN